MTSLPHPPAHLAALGRDWIAAWNARDLEVCFRSMPRTAR